MRILACALAALALAGCQRAEVSQEAASDAAAPAAPAAEAAGKPTSRVAPTLPLAQLAYRYSYALVAPAEAIKGLVARHEAICADAGPATCQVIAANVSASGADKVEGELKLRATPAWLKAFRGRLGPETEKAGGKVSASDVASEDLQRQIIDTEAQLRARTIMRNRLERLLASRPGKLADLMEVERELVGVQAEIDATRSALAVMRTRVATSELTIVYRADGVLAPEGVFAPLAEAVEDVVGLAVGTAAVIVRVVAVLAPLGVLGLLIAWLLVWRRRAGLPPRLPSPAAE